MEGKVTNQAKHFFVKYFFKSNTLRKSSMICINLIYSLFIVG